MKSTELLIGTIAFVLLIAPMILANDKIILEQKEEIYLKVDKNQEVKDLKDVVLESAPDQKQATAIRISGYVKTKGVCGTRDSDFLVVANVHYEQTPIFWYDVLYPETGTHPWQYLEKYVTARLPIKKVELHFRFKHPGEVWFKEFKVEEIPSWKDAAELVVATLGDSTSAMGYMPDNLAVWNRLEMLLRDRFSKNHISVRCIAESGEYLEKLLSSGRLERELKTLERCDFMIIRYGLNDNGHKIPPETFKNQLSETCDRVLKVFPGVTILLATTIPPNAPAYDAMTRLVAKERNYTLIDIAAFLKKEADAGNGNWHNGAGTRVGLHAGKNPPENPDGLKGDKHPNAYGAQLIAEQKFRVLEPLVEKKLKK